MSFPEMLSEAAPSRDAAADREGTMIRRLGLRAILHGSLPGGAMSRAGEGAALYI